MGLAFTKDKNENNPRWSRDASFFVFSSNRDAAAAQYRKAEGVFGEYAAMVPAHAELANQWRGLCHLSIARMNAEVAEADERPGPPVKVFVFR